MKFLRAALFTAWISVIVTLLVMRSTYGPWWQRPNGPTWMTFGLITISMLLAVSLAVVRQRIRRNGEENISEKVTTSKPTERHESDGFW